MELLHLFSTDQSMPKHWSKKSTSTNAALKASLLLACLVGGGILFYTHFDQGNTGSPPPYALQLRPDYPVSTFLYERGFLWFLGLAATVVGAGITFGAVAVGCITFTAGLGTAGCVLAATSVVTTVIGIAATVDAAITRRRYHLAKQKMIYMDWVDKSAKESIDRRLEGIFEGEYDPAAADRELEQIFGKTYKFEGLIDKDDEMNRQLYEKHGGPIPVFSFTAPNGLHFHHAMVPDEHSSFHRFALVPKDSSGLSSRGPTKYKSSESFKHGGLDMQDCALSEDRKQRLNQGDNGEMKQQLSCNDGNLEKAVEIAAQIYDATTQETIGAGKVAPFNSHGDSRIFSDNSCPSGLNSKNCGKQKGP